MSSKADEIKDFEIEEESESEEESGSDEELESEEESGSDEESESEENDNFWDSLEENTDEQITNLEGYTRSDEFQNEVGVSDTFDYSSYFENLQSIGILMTGVMLGAFIGLSFIIGFKKNE